MTMHLVRGMSSLNTKKRKQKKAPGWQKAKDEHDAFLKKMGVHPTQLKKSKKPASILKRKDEPKQNLPELSNTVGGLAPKKEQQHYTGTYITGIATMHKSNMIPISSKKDAIEVARMRRG
jgi:hypothetical protein